MFDFPLQDLLTLSVQDVKSTQRKRYRKTLDKIIPQSWIIDINSQLTDINRMTHMERERMVAFMLCKWAYTERKSFSCSKSQVAALNRLVFFLVDRYGLEDEL
jgi:hypothetical protein